VGDVAETLAIKQVFGEYANSIPISAPKSMMGHLAGAAGSVEAAAALLALNHNLVPPTINQEYPDPACDLDYVPNVARPASLQTVIVNSFAFGGVNTVLVFRRLEHDD
jgi:3-oxoacyl-[acyl-carrier-protein] synthase II